jgi:hypothetical protein
MNTECYAENTRPEQVLAWLQRRVGPLQRQDAPGISGAVYRRALGPGAGYDLQLTPCAAATLGIGWLQPEPWPDQLSFAREAAQGLGCRVWCSGEAAGVDPRNPYLWWRIDETGEGPATWSGFLDDSADD